MKPELGTVKLRVWLCPTCGRQKDGTGYCNEGSCYDSIVYPALVIISNVELTPLRAYGRWLVINAEAEDTGWEEREDPRPVDTWEVEYRARLKEREEEARENLMTAKARARDLGVL